jgi:hypothetical protein
MASEKIGFLSRYFILAYVVFWVLLGITGALIALKVPASIQSIMQNVCAWAPTISIILLFKKLYPNTKVIAYLKQNFLHRVSLFPFLLLLFIQGIIVSLAIMAHLVVTHNSFGSLSFISPQSLLLVFIITITSGPMGEELGWRGYALIELQKRFSLFTSAVLLGVLWGFWHTPLWIISGYHGIELIAYITFFLLGIVSASIVITIFYNKNRNILIAMWIHFLFNFLLRLPAVDILELLKYTSIGYVIFALILLIINRKSIFTKPIEVSVAI